MADWGPRSSNPYLGVSRRLLIPYEAVLWYVCKWEDKRCNVPYPNLPPEDVGAILKVWEHEHECRERQIRDQR